MKDIDKVYHRKLQASKEELYEACQGFITDHNIYLLQMIRQNILSREAVIEELNKRIKTKLMEYDNVLERLKKIPGLDVKTIENLLAEIGLDMSVFPSENHLASWAGMCPGNNESAGKKKADAPITGTNRLNQ
jgi:transposase